MRPAVSSGTEIENLSVPDAGRNPLRRILRIQPRLHRPAVDRELVLLASAAVRRSPTRSCHSTRSTPVILLGHRVLDLEARVHFHEPDAVGAQAFRASAMNSIVPAPTSRPPWPPHRAPQQRLAGRRVHAGRGRFLDHLLVAALERAVALEQVDDIAVAVAEHLHLDVARARGCISRSARVVAERARRLALAASERVGEIGGFSTAACPCRRRPRPP
jgi:hypothetical protein